MTDIGVGRGKLYLWRRRWGRFPRHRLPRRLQRLLGVGLPDNDCRRRFAAPARQFPRLDPRLGVVDRPGLIPGLGMNDRPRVVPWLGVDHLPGLDSRLEAEDAGALGRVGGPHRAHDVLDFDQSRNGDEQVDAGGRDAHARAKAKPGRSAGRVGSVAAELENSPENRGKENLSLRSTAEWRGSVYAG